MSIAIVMLLLGVMLIYAGWNNLSVPNLLRGDNQTKKAA